MILLDNLRNTPISNISIRDVHGENILSDGFSQNHAIVKSSTLFNSTLEPSYIPGAKHLWLNRMGTNTVYLPFLKNKITTVELPLTGSNFFITDPMSGCAFFICKKLNTNQLIVCHANILDANEKHLLTKKPNVQTKAVKFSLGKQIDSVLKGYQTKGGLKLLKSLYKEDYLEPANHATSFYKNIRAFSSKNADSFLGGTMIVGFQDRGKWGFWSQSFMRCGISERLQVISFKQFY
jgi:hypothetical protein